MIEKLAFNQYLPQNSYYPGGVYENPANPKNAYDPQAAVALLAEAGWKDRDAQGRLVKNGQPLVVEMLYATQGFEPYLTTYQEGLRRVGITLNLRLITHETQFQMMNQRRFQMTLMLVLAGAAVFLAGIGIYGVVSQTVMQRTGEYGIRIALGASIGDICALVLRRALQPVVLGLAVGMIASIGAGRVLRTLLFGMSPTDVTPFAAASVFLLGVAIVATLVPARRATRVDPTVALRAE